jgi:hypothetical protein
MSAATINKISDGGSGSRCAGKFRPNAIAKLIYCVTQAEVEEWKLRKPDNECLSLYIADSSTDLSNYIAFPFVDTCVGVICYMADKTVIATHISSYHAESDSILPGKVMEHFVNKAMAGKAVLSACIFGDTGTWFPNVGTERLGLPGWKNLRVEHKTPVDAILDVFCGKLIINDHNPKREFRNPIPDGFIEIQVYS